MDVAILVPMFKRAHRVEPFLTSLYAATPPQRARVLWIVAYDDHDVLAACQATTEETLVVPWEGGVWGDYARKINAGYRATSEPWMLTAADDLRFEPGWLDAGLAYAGPEIGVIGTNDLGNDRVMKGYHSTHSLVARWYADKGCSADQTAMIYHEEYQHTHCDDEMVQTAIARGAFVHAADCIVEHMHPHWGKAPTDDVYVKGEDSVAFGRRIYRRRKLLWYQGGSWE